MRQRTVCWSVNVDVASLRQRHSASDYEIYLYSYEVERLLYRMKSTSPGLDNIPRWFFQCSYEIADVVAHILNVSFFFWCGPTTMATGCCHPSP